MKLFIVPSWYPSPLHPDDGTFFRDQARLLAAAGVQVVVISSSIRSFREWSLRRQFDNPENPERRDGILEYRRESLNPGPKLPHVFFRTYQIGRAHV